MKKNYVLVAVATAILVMSSILFIRYRNSRARAVPWKECNSAFGQIPLAISMYKDDYSGQLPSTLDNFDYFKAPYMRDYALLAPGDGDYLLYRKSPLPELHRGDLVHIIGIDDVDDAMKNSPDITPPTRPCLIVESDGSKKTAKYIPEDEFSEFLKTWTAKNRNHNKSGLEQPATPSTSP